MEKIETGLNEFTEELLLPSKYFRFSSSTPSRRDTLRINQIIPWYLNQNDISFSIIKEKGNTSLVFQVFLTGEELFNIFPETDEIKGTATVRFYQVAKMDLNISNHAYDLIYIRDKGLFKKKDKSFNQ